MKRIFIIMFLWLMFLSCSKKEDLGNTKTQSGNLNTNKQKVNIRIVEKGSNISVHYTWTLEDWSKFDSSLDRWEPLVFTVWAGQMIAWFDAWVIWMKIWEKKKIEIEPKDAYGEYDKNKKQSVAKKDLESFVDAWIKLEAWVKLPTSSWEFEIIEVSEENVTIDINHPLAWKKLIFDVEIVEIK